MTQSALRVERVGHVYDDQHGQVDALDNISFEIKPGEFVCLVGPSGSGKSTLLRIMAGLIQPQQGRVWLDAIAGPILRAAPRHNLDVPITRRLVAEVERRTNLRRVSA